jgi:hypothetical protein
MQPNLDVLSVYFNYAAAMRRKVAVKFGRSAPGAEPKNSLQFFRSQR